MRAKNKNRLLLITAILFLVVLLVLEIANNWLFSSLEYFDEIYNITTRFLGGAACLIFVYLYSAKKALKLCVSAKSLLVFLPCMAVAVNNFPFVTYLSGQAYIDKGPAAILLYAMLCLGVGFFEEMAFRGCFFPILLQRRGNSRLDVFIAIVLSSVIFGLVHVVNLFAGSGIVPVVMQVGYSFLIGGMCSVILVKTRCIWYCVLLHSVYNFCGGVVPNCGGGVIWNAPEIALTAVVAIFVAIYVVYLLLSIKPQEIDALLCNETKTNTDFCEMEK